MKSLYTIIFIIVSSIFTGNLLSAQNIEELNKFKYINLPPLEYLVGEAVVYDVYGIQEIVKKTLLLKSINVSEISGKEAENLRDNCEIGHCYIGHYCTLDPNRFDKIVIYFTDCNFKLVYQCSARVTSLVAKRVTTAIPMGRSAMQQATKDALKEFNHFNYSFDADHPIIKTEFAVSPLDKRKIKAYLKDESHKLDVIEGIYESLDVDFSYVKLAIIKNVDWYDLIVIESDNITWKPGQIRGKLIQTENDSYTGNWLFTADLELDLEIEKGKRNRVYDFRFIDNNEDEYFEIEFKKK